MDGKSFDDLARLLAAPRNRRRLLAGLASGLIGLAVPGAATAATCRSAGLTCSEPSQCCSRVCGEKDATGRRRCACPSGSVNCDGACVDPTAAYQSDPLNCGAWGTRCPRTRCQVATCAGGVCGLAPDPRAVGLSCDDGDRCTGNDVCQSDGSCKGTPVVCTPEDDCHSAACDATTGACVQTPLTGTACVADNNACTVDTCQAGVCTAGTPKDCTTDPAFNDQCNVGVCNTSSGQCEKQAKENGTSCNDGNRCTQTDTCQAGVCKGSNPVVCPAPQDQCHVAGSCDPALGTCSPISTAPHGTACSDGNPLCVNGACCTAGHEVVNGGCFLIRNDGGCSPGTCLRYGSINGSGNFLCGVATSTVCSSNANCPLGQACNTTGSRCLTPC